MRVLFSIILMIPSVGFAFSAATSKANSKCDDYKCLIEKVKNSEGDLRPSRSHGQLAINNLQQAGTSLAGWKIDLIDFVIEHDGTDNNFTELNAIRNILALKETPLANHIQLSKWIIQNSKGKAAAKPAWQVHQLLKSERSLSKTEEDIYKRVFSETPDVRDVDTDHVLSRIIADGLTDKQAELFNLALDNVGDANHYRDQNMLMAIFSAKSDTQLDLIRTAILTAHEGDFDRSFLFGSSRLMKFDPVFYRYELGQVSEQKSLLLRLTLTDETEGNRILETTIARAIIRGDIDDKKFSCGFNLLRKHLKNHNNSRDFTFPIASVFEGNTAYCDDTVVSLAEARAYVDQREKEWAQRKAHESPAQNAAASTSQRATSAASAVSQ